jgi:hypothetical protein
MLKLNLPDYKYQVKKAEGKVWIFDIIRKKFVILTSEEWVRQHFLNYLIEEMKYPRSLLRIESGLTYNGLQKRSDILVYNREGNPWMIVECKAPDQKLTQHAIKQVAVYNTTLKTKYVTVTNGLQHYCYEVDWLESKTSFLQAIPHYK